MLLRNPNDESDRSDDSSLQQKLQVRRESVGRHINMAVYRASAGIQVERSDLITRRLQFADELPDITLAINGAGRRLNGVRLGGQIEFRGVDGDSAGLETLQPGVRPA